MPAISINSASLWANQISALSAQCAAKASALSAAASNAAASSAVSGGGGLFGDLVSALTRGSVTVNSPAAATTVSPASSISSPSVPGSSASRSQIAQDLQAFTQSLREALAPNQAAQLQSGGSAASAGIGVPTAATGASSGLSSAASSASIANLNTTFSRLMNDLNISTSPSFAGAAGTPVAGGASNGVSTPSPSAVLPRLMQGMLQHLQQQGSMAASIVHLVA